MGPVARCAEIGILLLGLAVAPLGIAAADDVAELAPRVRVLLLETAGSVQVAQGTRRLTLKPARRAVSVDGRAVGPVWRLAGRNGSASIRVDGLRVRGDLEARRVAAGLQLINRVDLEDYVAGTLGREVYSDWHPEMLKAQAVVTRTYALYQMARSAGAPFDLGAGTASQVYGGADAVTPAVRRATQATRGQFLAYGHEPILAVFHSAAGGQTAAAEEVWGEPLPYLVSVPVENEEDSPDTYWRASISRTTLGPALAEVGLQVGSIEDVRVTERSASGRALRVEVRGSRGTGSLEARALRTALGASVIRSTLFEIRPSGDGFTFVGSGHGHGVGMSQWGAQAMAKSGAGYREILATFYPGTQLLEGASR